MALFLAEIAARYPNESIVVLLDGAGWHKSQTVTLPANIGLLYLPPYSPQINPVEHLWEELREKHFHNHAFDSPDALEDPLVAGLAALEKNPQRVRSVCDWEWIIKETSNANWDYCSVLPTRRTCAVSTRAAPAPRY